MAELTLGFGSAHAPIMSLPPEKWGRARTADMMEIPMIDWRGERYTYEELEKIRHDAYMDEQNSLEVRTEKHKRCQAALDNLRAMLTEEKPDVIIVIGDDHHESFKPDIQPMFAVFHGTEVTNFAVNKIVDFMNEHTPINANDPDVQRIIATNNPQEDESYPIQQELALQIIEQGRWDGFDLTACGAPPAGPEGVRDTGHAVSFIYRRLMEDLSIPCVPILMNTYFPPNQPTAKRCEEFGRMIGRAVKAWDSDLKVAFCASGGLTHFAIDEDWDRRVIQAFEEGDFDWITTQPEEIFGSGTSEVKNWLAVAAAMDEVGGFRLNMIDYVPCYRALAGTGTGAGFGVWRKEDQIAAE